MNITYPIFYLAISLFFVATFLGLFLVLLRPGQARKQPTNHVTTNNKCDMHSCGAIDPVSDPAYNMKEIIKQSILLEDHLAEDRKYCRDCVCKHMMAEIAYAEEALTLAGNKLDQYPHMKECPDFYQRMFDTWSKNKNDERVRRDILTELREMRKKLMSSYLMAAS